MTTIGILRSARNNQNTSNNENELQIRVFLRRLGKLVIPLIQKQGQHQYY